jgi:threonine-phosphate decarboxylase
VPSSANFFLCELIDPAWEANALALALARQGILIRVCDDFAGLKPGRFIRIAIRRPEENRRFIRVLKELLVHAG